MLIAPLNDYMNECLKYFSTLTSLRVDNFLEVYRAKVIWFAISSRREYFFLNRTNANVYRRWADDILRLEKELVQINTLRCIIVDCMQNFIENNSAEKLKQRMVMKIEPYWGSSLALRIAHPVPSSVFELSI